MRVDLTDFHPVPEVSEASTMPSRWYQEPEIFVLEKEKIFGSTWQPVARADQVLMPGDYVACELQNEPIVIVRTTDGMRAFSNVCRHRAGVIATDQGNRKSLQCQYHGWTYSLDGRLLSQPEFEGVKNWNKSEICLPQFRVTKWGPYVFINLNENSPDLREILGEIPNEIDQAHFDIDAMHFFERREYAVNCNWKVYIDNYLEGYHIPMAHPGLFREIDYEQYRVDTFRYYSSAFAPIRPLKSGEITGRDRRYVRSEAESQALYYWIFPNFMINIYPDNLQANIILPDGPDRTRTIFEWYFKDPGTAEGRASMQESITFSDQIQMEDIEICEYVQRGLRSRTYDRGRFSGRRENGVHHFHLLVHEFLTGKES